VGCRISPCVQADSPSLVVHRPPRSVSSPHSKLVCYHRLRGDTSTLTRWRGRRFTSSPVLESVVSRPPIRSCPVPSCPGPWGNGRGYSGVSPLARKKTPCWNQREPLFRSPRPLELRPWCLGAAFVVIFKTAAILLKAQPREIIVAANRPGTAILVRRSRMMPADRVSTRPLIAQLHCRGPHRCGCAGTQSATAPPRNVVVPVRMPRWSAIHRGNLPQHPGPMITRPGRTGPPCPQLRHLTDRIPYVIGRRFFGASHGNTRLRVANCAHPPLFWNAFP